MAIATRVETITEAEILAGMHDYDMKGTCRECGRDCREVAGSKTPACAVKLRKTKLLKKLDAMPGTNIDLKDAVRKRIAQNRLPPFAKGSDTSKEAAESMRVIAPALRETVFEFIKSCGEGGTTCDDAEAYLGLTHQTCSARFNELVRLNRIVDSGHRRKTRSGRSAAVYILRASS